MELNEKITLLENRVREAGRDGLCIAFSGGVDSSLLLKIAARTLGEKASAVTFSSRLSPKTELDEAKELVRSLGVRHFILTFDEFTDEKILSNPPDRCYHCKKFIFTSLKNFCAEHALGAVADGTNADDLGQYRPGLRALRELSVLSPLAELGFTKDEVRAAARLEGLPVYDKPSAPCLATRIPYGERLTDALLRKVEASEACLKELGFPRCRVRAHGDVARIEVGPEDFARLIDARDTVICRLHEAGFPYVTLDLEGFRSGSMDLHILNQNN